MHLLLSPGSPPSSLWVARTCPSATVRKAHASPAVGNLPEPSEVGVICLLSLPDTQTRAQTHRHTRPPPPRGSPMVGTSSGGSRSPSLPPRGSAWPSCFSRRLLQMQKHIPLLQNGREQGSRDRFYGVKSLPRLHWNTHKNYAVQPAGTKK